MFYTREALLKAIPCLSHGNTYLKQSHVLHMAIFTLLSQDLHDRLGQRDREYLPSQRSTRNYSPGQESKQIFSKSQTFDQGQRLEYMIYWSATPLH